MQAATLAAGLGLLAPAVLAQNNQSYYDYTTNGNPQLDQRTLATIPLGFPDCDNGPLAGTAVCNTSVPAYQRASALVSMMTLEEVVNNTVNTAPGVPEVREGLGIFYFRLAHLLPMAPAVKNLTALEIRMESLCDQNMLPTLWGCKYRPSSTQEGLGIF